MLSLYENYESLTTILDRQLSIIFSYLYLYVCNYVSSKNVLIYFYIDIGESK